MDINGHEWQCLREMDPNGNVWPPWEPAESRQRCAMQFPEEIRCRKLLLEFKTFAAWAAVRDRCHTGEDLFTEKCECILGGENNLREFVQSSHRKDWARNLEEYLLQKSGIKRVMFIANPHQMAK